MGALFAALFEDPLPSRRRQGRQPLGRSALQADPSIHPSNSQGSPRLLLWDVPAYTNRP